MITDFNDSIGVQCLCDKHFCIVFSIYSHPKYNDVFQKLYRAHLFIEIVCSFKKKEFLGNFYRLFRIDKNKTSTFAAS
jgi:hypothetical protein